METLYTGKQINELLGTPCEDWACKGSDLFNRASKAGLKIETAIAAPGKATLYRIIGNDFYHEGEEWRTNIFDENYEVSSEGRYRHRYNKKLINGSITADGYRVTNVRSNSKSGYSTLQIHRAVYFSFHPELFPNQNAIIIDHINGKRSDNRLENLQPLTAAGNMDAKNSNRERIHRILTDIIIKYGYEKTYAKLQNLLKEGDENE